MRALCVVLRRAGFELDAVSRADQALRQAALVVPDAAIMELIEPDGDGIELCRRLREWSAMPLIVLSASDDEESQVRAFEAGADDYLTKPFRPRELVARLEAKLRRAERTRERPRMKLDHLEIDLASHVVRRKGEVVHLTPIEFKLLRALVRNRGRQLTHHALLLEIWGAAYLDDTRTLRTHMANLRRKIEPADGVRLIRTDHGIGYRLADGQLERVERGLPSDETADRESDRGQVIALEDKRAPATTSLPGRGLRVA